MRLWYTRPALADLDAINDYIAELLPSFPAVGGQTANPRIRRATISPYPYLISSEVGDGEIIVHAIRHGPRIPSGMPGSSSFEPTQTISESRRTERSPVRRRPPG